MIRIAIVEDDARQRRQIRELTQDFFSRKKEQAAFYEYADGSEIIENYPSEADLILMDIDMPKMNGLDAARIIREQNTEVDLILVTYLIQCALDGYSVSAMDFVVKPVTKESLTSPLKRAYQRFCQRKEHHIEVRWQKNRLFLNVNQILYAETVHRNTLVHCKDKDVIISEPISSLQNKLSSCYFYRCHVSFLVNLKMVDYIGPSELTIGEATIPVSKHRKKELLETMAAFAVDCGSV